MTKIKILYNTNLLIGVCKFIDGSGIKAMIGSHHCTQKCPHSHTTYRDETGGYVMCSCELNEWLGEPVTDHGAITVQNGYNNDY